MQIAQRHSTNLSETCNGLLEALQKFDEDTLPLGLYASDELVERAPKHPHFQEWKGAIVPYLSAHGYQTGGMHQYRYNPSSRHFYRSSFSAPDSGLFGLTVVRFSNIKVRKYGSGYQVDKHENREPRWQEVALGEHISDLWNQRVSFAAQILLFVGFDKAQRPLESEISALQRKVNWEGKGVDYQTLTWSDHAGRGFAVRLCAWWKLVEPIA